jgi:hypothetical protein
LVSDRFVNVATPLTAVAVAVPPRVAAPGFVPKAMVTTFLKHVAVLPDPSRAVTVTEIADPAAVLAGCVVNASVVTGQGLVPLSEWHVTVNKAMPAAVAARARRTEMGRRLAECETDVSGRIRVPSRALGDEPGG